MCREMDWCSQTTPAESPSINSGRKWHYLGTFSKVKEKAHMLSMQIYLSHIAKHSLCISSNQYGTELSAICSSLRALMSSHQGVNAFGINLN